MNKNRMLPQKTTRPVQLITSWLVGLIVLDWVFLVAALLLGRNWAAYTLVIAAAANVPLFLIAIFLLRVKFRSEFRGDSFQYLDNKTNRLVTVTVNELYEARFSQIEDELERLASQLFAKADKNSTLPVAAKDWSRWRIALNDNLESFAEIRKAMQDAKIPLASIFGKVDGTNPPAKKIVIFNDKMGIEYIAPLLKILLPFNLDGFKINDMSREIKTDDVIIGAYDDDGFAPISDDLKALLDRPLEKADLDYYAKSRVIDKP